MTRLLEEYFQRDLGEEEEEQLAGWLASSPDGAQRLIELMESHYRRLGPQAVEPDWAEKPLPDFFPKTGIRRHPLLLLALAALILALAWYGAHRWFAGTPVAPITAPLAAPKAESGTEHHAVPGMKTERVKAAPQPVGKTYEELSVVVDSPRPALVTVRVLDAQEREIRLLYAGILPAGQRTFTWDGKASAGTVIPPGAYYLEVVSGDKTMRKLVHVRAGGAK